MLKVAADATAGLKAVYKRPAKRGRRLMAAFFICAPNIADNTIFGNGSRVGGRGVHIYSTKLHAEQDVYEGMYAGATAPEV
jgi:hypothetical protein